MRRLIITKGGRRKQRKLVLRSNPTNSIIVLQFPKPTTVLLCLVENIRESLLILSDLILLTPVLKEETDFRNKESLGVVKL